MYKNSWIIRKANIKDAEGLKKCMEMSYSKYLDRLDGKQLPPMYVDYKEEIASYPVWVVEMDSEIVGGLILMFDEDYAKIANIAVRPDFQGIGMGRTLLEYAESQAKNKGFLELSLATHVLLTENVSYYNHLGWEETGRDSTRVYMKKNLNKN